MSSLPPSPLPSQSPIPPSHPNENSDIQQQKKELRKQLRTAIKQLSDDDIQQQSHQVWERLFELDVYKSAKTIGLFLSMPHHELKTDEALQHAIQSGKDVFVPVVGEFFEFSDMELRKIIVDPSQSTQEEIFHRKWPRNKWNIPEPPTDMPIFVAKPGDLDLLIVPGLGFDRKGNRLGQGKGYYDRFIAKMTENSTPLPLVAVALSPQLSETEIPMAEYDKRMDMIVLPDEVIKVK